MRRPVNVGEAEGCNGRGRDVSFVCGTVVSFSLTIDEGVVLDAKFRTNGCGYMMAAADVLCGYVKGRPLSDLHGLADDDLRGVIVGELGKTDRERRHCVDTCIGAVHAAFADHRKRLIDEFSGEKAIVCTCFGISEEAIEQHIATGAFETVEQITEVSRAGRGCGSCRMLIQEMLDLAHDI